VAREERSAGITAEAGRLTKACICRLWRADENVEEGDGSLLLTSVNALQ